MRNVNYRDITSWALACAATNVPETLPAASEYPERFRKSQNLHYQLMVMTEAINGDWVPNMEDTTQRKWSAWFWIVKEAAGFGLSLFGTGYSQAITALGSRLVFETEEQAKFAAKQFIKLYAEYYLRG